MCVYKGVWADRRGTLATGEGPYQRDDGALAVTVVRWPRGSDRGDGLERLDDPGVDPRLVDAELQRLRRPISRLRVGRIWWTSAP